MQLKHTLTPAPQLVTYQLTHEDYCSRSGQHPHPLALEILARVDPPPEDTLAGKIAKEIKKIRRTK